MLKEPISQGSKAALQIRSGDFSKTGPGARARADAAKAGKVSSGSALIPGANGFVPKQSNYHHSHKKTPLSCKSSVKFRDDAFQDNADNNSPPPEGGNFDASQYKSGPSPFRDQFNYSNPKHTRQNTRFSNKRRMSHSYDGHAEICFGMKQNRNNESLERFEKNIRDYIESPETEKISASYRYETPAYHYMQPGLDLVVTVNATDNEYISVRNATDFQLEKLEMDGNLAYDSRPSLSLTLKFRGPKNNNIN